MDQSADRVVVEFDARTGNYLSKVRAARNEFNSHMVGMGASSTRMEQQVSASANRMSNVLGRAIAGVAVGAAIKEVGQYADAWTMSANKLASAGVVLENVGAKQNQLVELARDTRTEYIQTADIYARVTRSTEQLNATDAQRLRLTGLINKAVKAGGATTAEQISTITQLGQALASGNLQGDELRSIRENAPLIARAIAQEFETTIGGLKDLGAEGEITADRVVKAILNAGTSIDAKFATTKATIGESFTALETEATRFFGNLDKAIGTTEGIRRFTETITEDFDLMAQAVIVSAAVAGGAIVGKLTVPLQQAAVSNANFVRSLVAGTTSMQQQANATKAAAREVWLKAQNERDAARESVVATQARINALRQEAAAYQQNVLLAEQQRAAVAAIAGGRASSGQFVSREDQGRAEGARNTATKALIASRMQLNRVTNELSVQEARLSAQHNALYGSITRVTAATHGLSAAIARSSTLANIGAVSMRGLSAAMGFFGGPIGIAIMSVAAAVAYFATEAAKAEAAGDNLRATLAEAEQQADETRQKTDDLSTSQKDGAKASTEAATQARVSADAYDAVATAASNAAEMVKYLTAAQRQQRLEKLDEQISDLRKARDGANPFTTNQREALANERARTLRMAGLDDRADRYAGQGSNTRVNNSEELRRRANAPDADPRLKEAFQRYVGSVAAFNEGGEDLRKAVADRTEVINSLGTPTLEKPALDTSNLVSPPQGSSSGGKTGGGSGRTRREETREELEYRREQFELEQRLQLQRAAGAETLARFTQDELDRRRIIASLIDQKYDPADAEAAANAYMAELRAARAVADANEKAEKDRKASEKQKEDDARAAQTRQERLQYLAEQDLLLQREMAALAGDSLRVKELDAILDRMQRIYDLQERGGLTPEDAARRVDKDQQGLDSAEQYGKTKELVLDPVKDALLTAFQGGDWAEAFRSTLQDKASDALSNAIDILYDAVGSIFKNMSSGGGGGGFFSKIGSAIFGGGRAGGGMMKPGMVYNFEENGRERIMVGSTARVLPNRVESATSGGGAAELNLNINLEGANGDETIRQIAYEAATKGTMVALGTVRGENRKMQKSARNRLG